MSSEVLNGTCLPTRGDMERGTSRFVDARDRHGDFTSTWAAVRVDSLSLTIFAVIDEVRLGLALRPQIDGSGGDTRGAFGLWHGRECRLRGAGFGFRGGA